MVLGPWRWRSGLTLKQQKHALASGEGRVFLWFCRLRLSVLPLAASGQVLAGQRLNLITSRPAGLLFAGTALLARLLTRVQPRRQSPQFREALRPLAVKPFQVRLAGQAAVVKGMLAAPAKHGATPLVELQAHLAGDVALRLLEESLQRPPQIAEPKTHVNQLSVAATQRFLELDHLSALHKAFQIAVGSQ